jgi:hypothetical protein
LHCIAQEDMLDPEGTFAHEEDDEESIADKRHKTLLEARLPPAFSTLPPRTRTHTRTHILAHRHTHTHTHTHTHAHTHACTHTHTHAHTHACTHTHARTRTHCPLEARGAPLAHLSHCYSLQSP